MEIFKTDEQKQILREYMELNTIIDDCRQKMSQLREEFCKTLPFKVGDYMTIHERWNMRQGWIVRMETDFSFLSIYYNPHKKDGTRSKREVLALVILGDLFKITISNPTKQ